jgi:pimeloyl-ACP methyl ester carboxylesterase
MKVKIAKFFVSLLALGGSMYFLWMVRNLERATLDETARRDAPGSFVRLPWGMVHYQLGGPANGPVVVLVHGLSIPLFVWDTVYEALVEQGYRVLRFDLYGRGYSDRPHAEYTISFFSDQLHDLLVALELEGPVHLMGVSMGGAIVAHYAGQHPEQVASVVLEAPFHAAFDVGLLNVPWVGEFVMGVQRIPMMANGVLSDFYDAAAAPADWPAKYRVQLGYEGFQQALLSTYRHTIAFNQHEVYEQLGATNLPLLLIWGQEDPLIPFAGNRELRALLPQVHFVPVAQAGHLPHAERPLLVLEALLGFWAGQS